MSVLRQKEWSQLGGHMAPPTAPGRPGDLRLTLLTGPAANQPRNALSLQGRGGSPRRVTATVLILGVKANISERAGQTSPLTSYHFRPAGLLAVPRSLHLLCPLDIHTAIPLDIHTAHSITSTQVSKWLLLKESLLITISSTQHPLTLSFSLPWI